MINPSKASGFIPWIADLKRGYVNKHTKQLLLTKSQIKELKKSIARKSLEDNDWDILNGMAETIEALSLALEEKNISLAQAAEIYAGSSDRNL